MSDLQSLLERLKGATGPDRETLREPIAMTFLARWYDWNAFNEGSEPWWRTLPDERKQAALLAADAVLSLLQALIASKSPSA